MKFLAVAFLFLFHYSANCQNFSNTWMLGERIKISFDESQLEQSTQPNIIRGVELTSAVSDSAGNLLFYTDGVSIWDQNHKLMNNGQDLFNDRTSTQSPVFIPHETTKSKYYLINHDANRGGIATLNIIGLVNDEYQVIEKNTVFDSICDESLAIIPKDGGYWIITHDAITSNTFKIHRLIDDKIEYIKSVNEGEIPNTFNTFLAVSRDKTKWCFTNRKDIVELYQFDICSGLISKPLTIDLSTLDGSPWLPIFSPDNKLLYLLTAQFEKDNIIYQYEIDSFDKNLIENSKIEIGRLKGKGVSSFGTLHSDDKIYLSRVGEKYISIINKPNLIGNNCFFEDSILQLNTQIGSNFPIPLIFPEPFIDLSIVVTGDSTLCPDSEQKVLGSTNWTKDAYWSTGEIESTITISNPGTYSLYSLDQYGCTITDTITISEDPDCPPDIADCHTYLPNAISTVSTRDNEAFYPQSSCPLFDYQMSIYDRWGGRVYHSSDPTQRWDGSSTDQAVIPGVYSYITHYRYAPDAEIISHSGTVTVIR